MQKLLYLISFAYLPKNMYIEALLYSKQWVSGSENTQTVSSSWNGL
jgi:hypothetical protein